MVDQDWMDSSNPGTWTDESRHPDTQLNYANEFDLNIKGWLLNEPNYRLGLMAGYQESRYSFTARGGSYIYSSEEDSEMISAPSRMEKEQSATNNVLKCPTLA
ncbi:outer membrane protease [Escherichia coli]|uniref:Outer membrane protease n=1 Tax=Escherichia coli TaxID=562 RepID=A0A377DKX7_ECOLX|nr:outer membrane protease [Escherichia coli]